MRIPLLLISVCLLAACGRHERAVVPVTPFTIYDIDAVRAALGGPRDVRWDRKLGDAVGLSRSKRRYDEAADSIKSVIYHVATPKAYFELGTALLMGKRYEEAVQALGVAERLQYSPLANVLYELSAAHARLVESGHDSRDSNLMSAVRYMQVALQMGFAAPEKFQQDPAFVDIRSRWDFKGAFDDAMDGRRDAAASLWGDFIHGFSPVGLPLVIDSQWFHLHPARFDNTIDFNYEKFITEMRTAQFSRGSEPGYFAIGRLPSDTSFVVLVYGGSDDWGDEAESEDGVIQDSSFQSTIYFYLTTFTNQGKIIDKIMVAGRNTTSGPEKRFSIGPSLEFTVSTDSATRQYRIDSTGRFQKIEPAPLASL